jgi:hypothetical protein
MDLRAHGQLLHGCPQQALACLVYPTVLPHLGRIDVGVAGHSCPLGSSAPDEYNADLSVASGRLWDSGLLFPP